MVSSFYWHNTEKTILVYQFLDNWTIDNVYKTIEMGNAATRKNNKRVDVIIDLSNCGIFPPNIFSVAHDFLQRVPEQVGDIVIVTGGVSLVSDMVNLFYRLHPRLGRRLSLATTIANALDYIKRDTQVQPI